MQEDEKLLPKDSSGKFLYSDVDYLETWASMESCVDSGFTRSIGVSNFNSNQLQRLLDNARIKPVVHQVIFS